MGASVNSILDKEGKLDEERILSGIKKYKFGLRNTHQSSQTYGFTLLLFAIIQNNIKIAKVCFREIQYKTIQHCVLDGIEIPAESSAVQIAILFRNYELVKLMLEYVQKENPDYKKTLASVNENNHSLLHTMILSKDKRMQQILIDTGYIPFRTELSDEPSDVIPPIILSIKENQPVMVNYIFQLCSVCAFRECSQLIIKQNAIQICQHLNEMLEDQKVDKTDLQQCRQYVVDFMYNILPKSDNRSPTSEKRQKQTAKYIEEHKSVTEECDQGADELVIRSTTQFNKYHTIKTAEVSVEENEHNEIQLNSQMELKVKNFHGMSSQSSFDSVKLAFGGAVISHGENKAEPSIMSTIPTFHGELCSLAEDSLSVGIK